MAGSDRVPDPNDSSEPRVGNAQTNYESEMALFFECMQKYAQKPVDTADIVREGMLQQLPRRMCPPVGRNEHPIQNPCGAARRRYEAPATHCPPAEYKADNPAPISEGSSHELPLAKKSPGVANAQPIQQSVIK
jgi:hypothetical protein